MPPFGIFSEEEVEVLLLHPWRSVPSRLVDDDSGKR